MLFRQRRRGFQSTSVPCDRGAISHKGRGRPQGLDEQAPVAPSAIARPLHVKQSASQKGGETGQFKRQGGSLLSLANF